MMTQISVRNTHRRLMLGLFMFMLAMMGWGFAPALAREKDNPMSADEAIRYADALSVAFEHAADAIRPSVVTIKAVKHFKPAQHMGGQDSMPGMPDGFLQR